MGGVKLRLLQPRLMPPDLKLSIHARYHALGVPYQTCRQTV